MNNVVVVGSQWGDEGKGKIVDLLSSDVDIVARYQGGANAGHTVYINDKKIVLHQVPSGIFREGCKCLLGNGMVIDPIELVDEFNEIVSRGMSINNIFISMNAHITTPIHKLIDAINEEKATDKIGTTGKGIGPTYVDKYNRQGIRACDLLDETYLKNKIDEQIQKQADNNFITNEQIDEIKLSLDNFFIACNKISSHIIDIMPLVHGTSNMLIEGAQGTLLDIDHGTYPYVTSSNPSSGGITTGLGFPISKIDRLVGIFKAYTTRVGNGPFPTEQLNEDGKKLQDIGKEFGATTGRPRRCGWFDIPLANYSVMINGFTEITITKLDVLDTFKEINVCVGYEYEGKHSDNLSSFINNMDDVTPTYKTIKGWNSSTEGINLFEKLPVEAQDYILYLEDVLQVPIKHISTGPKRNDIIVR